MYLHNFRRIGLDITRPTQYGDLNGKIEAISWVEMAIMELEHSVFAMPICL